jgi:hypothetical protein
MTARSAVAVAAAVVAAVVAVGLSACGGGSVTVGGTVQPYAEADSLTGGAGYAQTYSECSVGSPAPGAQVTVTSPSGSVIGTAKLGLWKSGHVTVSGLTIFTCLMPFSMSGVPSEPRYGFQIAGVPGTLWETSVSDVALSVGGSS